MEFKFVDGGVCAPKGFSAGGMHCGVRKNKDKKDLAMLLSSVPCAAAAVYTTNKVFGAPILVTRKNLQNGMARAVVCNSGNANTCNADGEEKAQLMCDVVAEALGIKPEDVVVASTGVIGQPLNTDPIVSGIKTMAPFLSRSGGHDAAQAIMTTDTVVKEFAVTFTLDGKECALAVMSKGSGMIQPNMATMLSFLTTDVAIAQPLLQKALSTVVKDTYNMISIDGDTSTNDMVCVLANGLAGNSLIVEEDAEYAVFVEALRLLATKTSRLIAGDGEGATKLLECTVEGAPDEKTAKIVAKSVINSSLFKAMMFGADANWGRVLCAVGYADAAFDASKLDVVFSSKAGTLPVCEHSTSIRIDSPLFKSANVPMEEVDPQSGLCENYAKKILTEKEIGILIRMNQGEGKATAWGCDLTYDYVKINGDYRT